MCVGALSGGFIDHKRSRMACQRQLKEAEKAFNQAKEESDKITREIEVCDQRVSKFMGTCHHVCRIRESIMHVC